MPFVLRKPSGEVVAIFQSSHEGVEEELPMNHPDILEFLNTQSGTVEALVDLAETDIAMTRVIEDLIELLILKGVIDFHELPEPAQEKLSQRQHLRGSLEEVLAMFGGGKVI